MGILSFLSLGVTLYVYLKGQKLEDGEAKLHGPMLAKHRPLMVCISSYFLDSLYQLLKANISEF